MNNPKAQFQIDNGSDWQTIAEAEIINGIVEPPNAWTMVRAMQKQIVYTGYTPEKVMVAPSSSRDTHFTGFAKLLADELRVTGGYPISEVKQLIARRAYDLAYHTLFNASLRDLDSLTTEECVINIPDLTELPKVQS